MARLSSLQLLLPLVGDTLQPLAALLQLPCLHSVHIIPCQPSGGALSQQLAAAVNLQQLSIQVSSRTNAAHVEAVGNGRRCQTLHCCRVSRCSTHMPLMVDVACPAHECVHVPRLQQFVTKSA
jgi:hypothetical protein